jgi:hypothetical protein
MACSCKLTITVEFLLASSINSGPPFIDISVKHEDTTHATKNSSETTNP